MDPMTMTIATMVGTGGKILGDIVNFFDDSADDALNAFMSSVTDIAGESKEKSIEYGDISASLRDPNSMFATALRDTFATGAEGSIDTQIRKLRSQGIYNPNLERSIAANTYAEFGTDFYQGFGNLLNVASQYSGLENQQFQDYTDTMTSAYQTQYTGELAKPGAGDLIGDIFGTLTAPIGADGSGGNPLGMLIDTFKT